MGGLPLHREDVGLFYCPKYQGEENKYLIFNILNLTT